jgi:antitoxin PrlF
MAARRPGFIGARAKMTSKGQVTVSKAIRDALGLRAGVTLHFSVDQTGRLLVTPLTGRLEDLVDILPKPEKPLTIEQINDAIEQAAVERVMRGLASSSG